MVPGMAAMPALASAAGGMGALSNAAMVGGGLSILGDLVGAGTSFGLGQMAVGQQWDKWKDSQTRGPQYRMIGLRKAGLNPILAARGGLGGAGGGGFSPSAVASGGGGLPLGSNALRASKEIALLSKQGKLLDAQTNAQNQNAALTQVKATNAANEGVGIRKTAQFYTTPEGAEILRRGIKNNSLPKGVTPAVIQALFELYQQRGEDIPDSVRKAARTLENIRKWAGHGSGSGSR